jgi:hypothetical protein
MAAQAGAGGEIVRQAQPMLADAGEPAAAAPFRLGLVLEEMQQNDRRLRFTAFFSLAPIASSSSTR